ncbi:ABC transporter ATP-binding protein/permease [Gordonia sp. HY002]|uniref:ABC transporter ATP-binding protein n=1 Tax=Gordonia zhenghanii TaxID=2911516 RepID=UPI001EF0AB11|nr:ABC transporter ATP-binding protein [Gordonia zhenghanii]MCF8568825.1 ABC transporter ATP-binding protein/permease [Gordonia zhenghanii]MCF8602305.1 ABC transporter ATP-binding protein/permease [Gordonia zhenghanii]
MIRRAFALVPGDKQRLIPLHLAMTLVYGVAQAAAFVLLVPLLEALIDGEIGRAGVWLAVTAVVVAVAATAGYVQSMLGIRLAVGMLRGVTHRLGDHLAAVRIGWFSQRSTASITRTVVADVHEIVEFFSHLLAVMVSGVVVPLGIGIGVLFIDWRLGVVMLVALPVMSAVDKLAGRAYRSADDRLHASATEVDARVLEFTTAQPVLRAFGAVGDRNRALDSAMERHRRASGGLIAASVPGLAAFSIIVQFVFVALVFAVSVWATDGDFAAATAVGLIVVVSRFIDPVSQLAQVSTSTRRAGAAIDRVHDLLDAPQIRDPEPARRSSGVETLSHTVESARRSSGAETSSRTVEPARWSSGVETSIAFDNVSFGYRDGIQVTRNVSFTVPAGTTTAVVGPSGSGKTTLLRLASRFYPVDGGAVRIGGVDVADMSLEYLMAQVSPVFQDVYLFNQTIEENIRIGRPDATDDEVRRAARVAAVDEIADRLPDGWNTVVGERGANLSGGERQRVSIARALLKDAPIVLLDEATSALDPHNEAVVVQGLRELTQGKTVVVVAHKLSTVAHADQIVVLDDGVVADRGTHAELSSRDGRYADFVAQRSRSRGWRIA